MSITFNLYRNFDGTLDGRYKQGNKPNLSLGYQPAGTTKPNDPNLVYDFNAKLEAAYQGAFTVSGESFYNGPTAITGLGGAMALSPSGTLFFSSENNSVSQIGELSIPTLTSSSDVTDRTNIQTASTLQAFTELYSKATASTDGGAERCNALYYDRALSKLAVSGIISYDAWPHSPDNFLLLNSPNDIANSTVSGFYQVKHSGAADNESAQTSSWVCDIPSAWQSTLGARTLFGGGRSGSISSRLPMGPTLYSGTFDSAPANGTITVNQHMAFYLESGKHLGEHYFTSYLQGANWQDYEFYNCDRYDATPYPPGQATTDSTQVDAWINNWFNMVSAAVCGFIIPNTRTYVVIGTLDGGESGSSYKGNPAWYGSTASGPIRVEYEDSYNKYWLFDLDDIVAATNPWEVFPYEHGYLPFLDQLSAFEGPRSKMQNACFDLHTGQLAIFMRARASLSQGDVLMFQSNLWQEAVV